MIKCYLSCIILAIGWLGLVLEKKACAEVVVFRSEWPADSKVETNWTAAEMAFRSALASDPTCTTNESFASQPDAVRKWQELIERSDLPDEQRAFAWARIGALLSYNFDPSHGERAEYEQAEKAFTEARKLFGDLICMESLNAASVYGTLPGKPDDRARRLAEAFIWVRSRTEQHIKDSASRVSESGRAIESRLLLGYPTGRPVHESREVLLAKELAYYSEFIGKRVKDLVSSYAQQNPDAINRLLASIQPWATPAEMQKWIELKGQSKFKQEGVRVQNPGARVIVFVCLALPSCAFLLWACWRRIKSSTSAVS